MQSLAGMWQHCKTATCVWLVAHHFPSLCSVNMFWCKSCQVIEPYVAALCFIRVHLRNWRCLCPWWGPQMVCWSRWKTWHTLSFDCFRSQLHREGRYVVCLVAYLRRWQVLIESLYVPVMLPVVAVYCYPVIYCQSWTAGKCLELIILIFSGTLLIFLLAWTCCPSIKSIVYFSSSYGVISLGYY